MIRTRWMVVVGLLTACSSSEEGSLDGRALPDRGAVEDLGSVGDGGVGDGARLDGLRFGDAAGSADARPSCTLGTPDNCKSCGDTCPATAAQTAQRVCVAKSCDIQCKGEQYDVNAKVADGCEVADDTPIHDQQALAASLGKVDDCGSTKRKTARLPSDARKHVKAPVDRPQGRADWFALTIADKAFCSLSGAVTVSLSNLPSTAQYRVTAKYVCDNGKKLNAAVKTASGGATVKLSPDTSCNPTPIGSDSGKVYVEVVKRSGPHATASYTVGISP